jgi:predicted nuclease of predicted toxin-antitoxin system
VKLLLDTCVWGAAKAELVALGYDAIWSGDWPIDPGDEEILSFATKESRVLVTLDKDFGELVFLKRQSHCGILRLHGVPSRQQATQIHRVIQNFGEALTARGIVTLNNQRVRIRLPMP